LEAGYLSSSRFIFPRLSMAGAEMHRRPTLKEIHRRERGSLRGGALTTRYQRL